MTMKTKVGHDEFCITCMEWREYDENGRCVVCGKIVKKKTAQPGIKSYDEYHQDNFDRDNNNEINGELE